MTLSVKDIRIVHLKDAGKETPETVGQKAYRLVELYRLGFVPPGLVLTADSVDLFWSNGSECSIPRSISDHIWQQAVESFGQGTLIVRSTGMEDREDLSFAGQFDSVTDVNDPESHHLALMRCICSSRSERVKRYQAASGQDFENGNAPFAVLLMPQRRCLYSGILFSNSYLGTSEKEYVAVQIVRGSNFGLTSGTETGDIFYIDRKTGRLGGRVSSENPVECTGEQIQTLYQTAIELEKFFGFAVDVEWGILEDGKTLEVFQARPIVWTENGAVCHSSNLRLQVVLQTTNVINRSLENLSLRGVEVESNFWSDQNIAELITDHPSRMAFGIFTYIFAHGHGAIRTGRNQMGYEIGHELEDGFFELVGGQPRCSIVHDALTYRVEGITLEDYVQGFVKRYLEKIVQDQKFANYPEVVLYEQNPSKELLRELFGSKKGELYGRYYDLFFSRIRVFEEEVAEYFAGTFVPDFSDNVATARLYFQNLEEMTPAELLLSAHSILDSLRMSSCVMFVKVARLGFFAYARLKRQLDALFGEEEGRHRLDEITSGLENDVSFLFNVKLASYRDGKISLEKLLSEYGHLGPNELEIANPRYRDQVELLKRMAESIQGDPEAELKVRTQDAYRVAEETARRGLASLGQDILVARTYLAMREKAKYLYLMEYDLLRRVLVQMAKVSGVEEEELIFELDPRELRTLIADTEKAKALMIERRQERELLLHFPVPQVFSLENLNEIGKEDYDPSARVLMGIGATPIITTGKAVVVLHPNDAEAISKLEPDCVLVTKSTDPTWAPIIAAVGGQGALVTEIGGPLAHGAIVARQLGIACVQNVPGATKRFKTGDILKVDGKHGTVTLEEG